MGENVSSLFRWFASSVESDDTGTASSEESCRFPTDVAVPDDSNSQGREFANEVPTVFGVGWPALLVVKEDGKGVEFVVEPEQTEARSDFHCEKIR